MFPAKRMSIHAHCAIIGIAMLAAMGSSCKSAETVPVPVPTISPQAAPSPSNALDPVNDVAAQGSVSTAIAASRKVFVKNGTYVNLTAASMHAVAPLLKFSTPSTIYSDVSFQIRGHSLLALAAMSPSGACFGALGHGDSFTYSHSDIGQTGCDAADVPYLTHGW